MGEFVAWIIGWDLILEYLVGAATVAVGWSSYFISLVNDCSQGKVPTTWTNSPLKFDIETGNFVSTGDVMNVPAFVVIILITIILVIGN